MPSDLYFRALREASEHHATSKTYSGRFLRPHKPFLTTLIEAMGIQSALDYGCGKGEQYRWIDPEDGETLEETWGFEVAKFDPAWPIYAVLPPGEFDLIMCTHSLGSVPVEDHEWVLDYMFTHARKAIFIAEKIGAIKKDVHGARKGFVNDWSRIEWTMHLAQHRDRFVATYPHLSVPHLHLSFLTRMDDGEKVTHRSMIP